MKIQETVDAILSGRLDVDQGGNQPDRRRSLRRDMRFLHDLVRPDLTPALQIQRVQLGIKDGVLTEEDLLVIATIKDELARWSALLTVGSSLIVRGNQSHRWDHLSGRSGYNGTD